MSTIAANGGGCISGGRLKRVPYPTLPRNESTKKFDYPPAHPTEMHPVLAKVLYSRCTVFSPCVRENIFKSGKQISFSASNAIKI
jgi:hypothetical protein